MRAEFLLRGKKTLERSRHRGEIKFERILINNNVCVFGLD